MTAERVTLDTNVLIYALDNSAGEKWAVASELVERAVGWDCIVTLQALAEFFTAATRKGKMSVTDAAAQIDDWLLLFPVTAAGPATLSTAMAAVRAHGLSFWDAMLWAAAREAGCDVVLSEDFQHGRVLGGVRFHNPFVAAYPSG